VATVLPRMYQITATVGGTITTLTYSIAASYQL
jgi:hypothetical protein